MPPHPTRGRPVVNLHAPKPYWMNWPEEHPFRHVHPECCRTCGTKSVSDGGRGTCGRCGWERPKEELLLFDLPAWLRARGGR